MRGIHCLREEDNAKIPLYSTGPGELANNHRVQEARLTNERHRECNCASWACIIKSTATFSGASLSNTVDRRRLTNHDPMARTSLVGNEIQIMQQPEREIPGEPVSSILVDSDVELRTPLFPRSLGSLNASARTVEPKLSHGRHLQVSCSSIHGCTRGFGEPFTPLQAHIR